jgi:hypothetical protein
MTESLALFEIRVGSSGDYLAEGQFPDNLVRGLKIGLIILGFWTISSVERQTSKAHSENCDEMSKARR